jgi:hypothetical protein
MLNNVKYCEFFYKLPNTLKKSLYKSFTILHIIQYLKERLL